MAQEIMNSIQDLHDKYPSVFDGAGSKRLDAKCGPGWLPLLETVCALMHERNLASQEEPAQIVKIIEKLGALRVLVQGKYPEVSAWTDFALKHSMRTCEICAMPGRLIYDNGWQRTRCESHRLDSISEHHRMSEVTHWITQCKDPGDGSGDGIIELSDDILESMGLKLGDPLTFNVIGGVAVLTPVRDVDAE